MRLTCQQQQFIQRTVKDYFGEDTNVYLFGSRTDDRKRGGDIDLLIEATKNSGDILNKKLMVLTKLHLTWGEQKIDIVVTEKRQEDDRLVIHEARKSGILL